MLNVIGTWLLLKPFGIIGAAFMTGFALLLGQGLVMNWFYYRRCGLNVFSFFREIMPVLVVPILLCSITLFLTKWIDFYRPVNLILGILLFALTDLIINWFLIMNSYEKSLIFSILKNKVK